MIDRRAVDQDNLAVGLLQGSFGLMIAVQGMYRLKPERVSGQAGAMDAYRRDLDGWSRGVAFYERILRCSEIARVIIGLAAVAVGVSTALFAWPDWSSAR